MNQVVEGTKPLRWRCRTSSLDGSAGSSSGRRNQAPSLALGGIAFTSNQAVT